jgi:hypothetical protein
VRGAIEVAFLERIEQILSEHRHVRNAAQAPADNIGRLYELATIAAKKQVKPEHWIDETSQAAPVNARSSSKA